MKRTVRIAIALVALAASAAGACWAQGDFSKRLKVSVALLDPIDVKDPVYAELCSRFNVEIEPVALNWDTWDDQVNIMTASGDVPDVLAYNLVANKMGVYAKLARQGVIRAVPDLSKYPNLAKLRDSMPSLEYLKVDGKLYAWPKARNENPLDSNGSLAIAYRRDWARKLGMDKKTFTVDEVAALALAFSQKDPGGNGKGKTVGYADVGWNFGYLGMAFWNRNDYEKVGGRYVWTPELKGQTDGVKFLRKMYRDGGYWRDFYSAKDYDSQALFASGLLGMFSDNLGISNFEQLKTKFRDANPGIDPNDAIALMDVVGPDGRRFAQEWLNWWSASVFSAKVDDEKMARILAMMDWMAGPEGSKLFFYGVKGKDWDEKDGKVALKWAKDDKGAWKAPAYQSVSLRTMAVLSGDFAYVNPSFSDSTREAVLAMYRNQHDAAKTSVARVDYPLTFLSSPMKDKYGNFSAEKTTMIKKLVAGTDDIDKAWADWVKSMKPKVRLVLDELDAKLK